MRKMPCVFVRNFDARPAIATDVVTPGCEWVLAGEGEATVKWDGTAALVQSGEIYARYDCKRGKTPPEGAIACDPEPDAVTGHWPHWVKVVAQPEYRWHLEALATWHVEMYAEPIDGTYEVIGPKVGGNPERVLVHTLRRHGALVCPGLACPRTFATIRAFLTESVIEGIVFHHPDGRMAKIRRPDFGLQWPPPG